MAYPEPILSESDLQALYNTLNPLGWSMQWIAAGVTAGEWIRGLAVPDLYALIYTLEPYGWAGVVEYAKYTVYGKEKFNEMMPWIAGGVGLAALAGIMVGKRR